MHKACILVIEDNPVTRKFMRITLESAGFSVLAATDGKEAIGLLDRADRLGDPPHPDLVLQDMLLPDIDGVALAKIVRDRLPSSVPIIAVSGLPSKFDDARSRGITFAACLTKPVEPSQLLEAVEAHLGTGEPAKAPANKLILVADDDPVQRKLIGIHLDRAGFNVEFAADGEEALKKAQSLRPDAVVSDILMPRMDGYKLCWSIRKTSELSETPVILLSGLYTEEADRNLARDVGASAFLPRTPDFQAVIRTLQTLWPGEEPASGKKAPPARSAHYVAQEHGQRLERQLEKQLDTASALLRRSAVHEARLAILAGVSRLFSRTLDNADALVSDILREALARCLEASGFSKGAAYLVSENDALALEAHVGFAEGGHPGGLKDFFGHLDWLDQVRVEGEPVTLPSARLEAATTEELLGSAGSRSMFILPLTSGERRLGVIVLGSDLGDSLEEAESFVLALQGQISQAVALGESMRALAVSERQFRSIAEAAAEGIVQTTPDGTITYLNRSAAWIFDTDASSATGRLLTQFIPTLSCEPGSWQAEGIGLNQVRIPLEGTTRKGTDRTGRPCLTHIFRDLTERKEFESRLIQLVNYDPLTGLFNRRRFFDELQRFVSEARLNGFHGALILMDLDQLRQINEKFGQQFGDSALSGAARIIKRCMRAHDIAARLGDDEFAVLMPHATIETAEASARAIQAFLGQHGMRFDPDPFNVSAGTGIAAITPQDLDAQSVITRAEAALRRAKSSETQRCCVFRPGDAQECPSTIVRPDFETYNRIRYALDKDGFRLVFQPLRELRSGKEWGYEALLRMIGADGNDILPGEFLPVAERSGLILHIDRWVMENAIACLPDLLGHRPDVVLQVNLSGNAFGDADFLAFIEQAILTRGAPPSSLCFEITETAAITNLIEARHFITGLRRHGCRFALDDFGVGFNSFHYLKHLPVDFIKIDGSFIRDLPRSTTDQHLVRAVIGMAKGLGKMTVAEHVGDEETLAVLETYGVDLVQGNFVGRPKGWSDIVHPHALPS